jgi:hypothetical protein
MSQTYPLTSTANVLLGRTLSRSQYMYAVDTISPCNPSALAGKFRALSGMNVRRLAIGMDDRALNNIAETTKTSSTSM